MPRIPLIEGRICVGRANLLHGRMQHVKLSD